MCKKCVFHDPPAAPPKEARAIKNTGRSRRQRAFAAPAQRRVELSLLGEVPVSPSLLVGGAAFLLWVVLLSLRGWRCLLHSFWVTVLSSLTGSLRRWRRGNASRQTKPQDQCKTVTLGHHSHALSLLSSLTRSLCPPLPLPVSLPPSLTASHCHSLPLSLAPCVSPSLPHFLPFSASLPHCLPLSPLSLPL